MQLTSIDAWPSPCIGALAFMLTLMLLGLLAREIK